MYEFNIPVRFEGSVRVRVPEDVSERDARALARSVAACRILATLENPDAPAEQAFVCWVEECRRLGSGFDDYLWEAAYDGCELKAGEWSTPTAEVYLHSCPETDRVFICEYDKDDNLAEVFPHDGLTAWEVGEKILASVNIG